MHLNLYYKQSLLFFFFIVISFYVHAKTNYISLDLDNIRLSDAIRLIAQFQNKNVMVSAQVQGITNLHLHNEPPLDVWHALLVANGLSVWELGQIWWVAPYEEILKRKQEELKWREAQALTTSLKYKIWRINYAKADEIVRLLQDEQASFLSKRGRVRADLRTNSIYLQDYPDVIKKVHTMIERLDIPIPQIMIEARLASIENDFERDLGINFFMRDSSDEAKSVTMHKEGRYSLAIAQLADGSILDLKLAALEKAGRAHLISHPSLFTANQETASIEAGEEVPYQEVSESGGTAVVFKKAVLGLKVTPRLLPGNKVSLQLQINQDRPSNKTVLGVPTISTRQITTQILVKNGETIALGGIYETNAEKGEKRLPFISQLPFLGVLFKEDNIRHNKRELIIFVTPKVIA